MRVSKETKEKIRADILDAAGQGFREMGYGSLGIDGLAKRIGMTSGAFYSHFPSKQEAFKEVVSKGLSDYGEAVQQFQVQHSTDWTDAFLDYYLGDEHVENLACSCAVPGLSAEVMRADSDTKKIYEKQVTDIATHIADGLDQGSLENAWALMGLLAGSVMLARCVSSPESSQQIVNSARLWAEKILADSPCSID